MRLCSALLIAFPLFGATAAPTGFPFTDETLAYSIVWPSGLSLGEARLSAAHSSTEWSFNLMIDAAIPGFAVKDAYRSIAGPNLCSAQFERETLHGARKNKETTIIGNGKAVRQTVGGGKSEIAVPACAHDALTALFFARRELGQGRVPASETILYGGAYALQLKYTGAQTINISDKPTEADRVLCSITVRENQKYEFEVLFARDPARTPLLIRAPFALGTISMELIR